MHKRQGWALWGLDKDLAPPPPGLRSPYRKHLRNKGPAAPAAGLPSPSSLARCHLSQSERPWQSAKFPGLYFTPCCRKGSRQALRSDFTPLPRALPLGELDAVRRPERASPLAGRLRPGLEGAYDGADFRKAQSKLTRCVLVSGLALSVIASRCHLSQSERPWQSAKFPVYTSRPAAARGAEGATLRLHAFAKGSPFGGAGAKRLRGQARQREPCAFV